MYVYFITWQRANEMYHMSRINHFSFIHLTAPTRNEDFNEERQI